MTGQEEGEVHISLRDEPVELDGSEEKRPLLPFFFFLFKVLFLWYRKYFLSIG